jgi:ubiquinone/menaquinone biosynthesis methyltransferase
MRRRFTLKMADYLKTPDKKRYYNERVFALIAPEYDLFTRPFSLWRDQSWKRLMVAALPALQRPVCVDLACGTGDIAFLLAGKYPDARISGLDITKPMLDRARRRNTFANVRFLNCDMGCLPMASGSVDIVTGSYALRNAPDLDAVIGEVARVIKPGGVGAFLDFSKPGSRVPQRLEYGLLKLWGGFWGILLHRNHEVYSYVAESLRLFPDRAGLRDAFARKDLGVVSSRLFFMGILEMLVVQKPT